MSETDTNVRIIQAAARELIKRELNVRVDFDGSALTVELRLGGMTVSEDVVRLPTREPR